MNNRGLDTLAFPKLAETDWWKLVSKELQDVEAESLSYLYHDDVAMPLAVYPHASDTEPIRWRQQASWCGGFSFAADAPWDSNLLEWAIRNGTSSFHIASPGDRMGTIYSLSKKYPQVQWSLGEGEKLKEFPKSDIKPMGFRSSEEDIPAQVVSSSLNAMDWLTKQGENLEHAVGSIRFLRPICPNYLQEIALGRAQRIVWRNMLKAFTLDNPNPPLFTSLLTVRQIPSAEQFLLEAGPRMLSALLGGSDRIWFEFSGNDAFPYLQNLGFIFQLFRLEAGIGSVSDPIAGSYYLEELTRKTAAWLWRESGGG